MVLNREIKCLESAGIGAVHQKAEPITFEEEILWQKAVLGDHNPKSLVNTMVSMNRLYFALCGGSEYRNLRHKPSQIQLIESLENILILCTLRMSLKIQDTVQLKCNLMPARRLPGEKVRVNLQMGACKGAGACNVLHQPGANL